MGYWFCLVAVIHLKQNGVLILFGCRETFKTKWGIDFVWSRLISSQYLLARHAGNTFAERRPVQFFSPDPKRKRDCKTCKVAWVGLIPTQKSWPPPKAPAALSGLHLQCEKGTSLRRGCVPNSKPSEKHDSHDSLSTLMWLRKVGHRHGNRLEAWTTRAEFQSWPRQCGTPNAHTHSEGAAKPIQATNTSLQIKYVQNKSS